MTTKKIKTDYPSYSVPYQCDNCDWSGTEKFAKGSKAPALVTCAKCGCVTARKVVALPYVPKGQPALVDPTPYIPGPPRPPLNPWHDDHYRPIKPWWDPYSPWRGDRIFCDNDKERNDRDGPVMHGYRVSGVIVDDLEFPPKTRENFHAHGCGRE